MDKYADIRPYHDSEVAEIVSRLIDDNAFIDMLSRYNVPACLSWCTPLARILVRTKLRQKLKHVNSIYDFQLEIEHYLQLLVNQTTNQLTYSGLSSLQSDQAYLFISNHRDIVLDPALVNLGLHRHQRDTVRIAIGDNLLQVPYISELMRLNKSFIVKRSAKAPKEMLKALSTLSAYIHDSLDEGHSIWIAQKEGRAKDGVDQTDPALLKMLQLHGRKKRMDFAEYIKHLKIVPVAISYQYEPCVIAKANEIFHKQQHGEYVKQEGEDIQSIIDGFKANKGNVHVAFGEPIQVDCETPEVLATVIDQQILELYQLHSSNYLAVDQNSPHVTDEQRADFQSHLAEIPKDLHDLVKAMYAEPVNRKKQN